MENTEKKQEEMIIREGALELCIDHDHITIPVTRFQKLVEAEVKLTSLIRFTRLLNLIICKTACPSCSVLFM